MVTDADVHYAYDTLDDLGGEPKYELIRAQLGGRESWSTNKTYMASWIARGQEVPPVSHAHLNAVIGAVWRCACPLASETFGEERRLVAAEDQESTGSVAFFERTLEARDLMVASLTQTMADLHASLADSQASCRDETERLAELLDEVAALTGILTSRSEPMPSLRVIGGDGNRAERV